MAGGPRTVIYADDEVREISEEELPVWKQEACSAAVSGHRLVLEDGPGGFQAFFLR
jgi:hypothetical protein